MITEITNNPEVKQLPEFDNHQAVFLLENPDIGFKGYISIHRENPTVPSFGATRMWSYSSDSEGLKDSMRLSRMMSYKSALAGLDCGGAKGVIVVGSQNFDREAFLREYSKCVDALKGRFVTGTDVGLQQEDLNIMREETPYIVGFNDNSVLCTTMGLYGSLEVSLQKVFGTSDVSQRSFAIQGLGKIGSALVSLLYESGCRNLYVSDVDQNKVNNIQKQFPEVVAVSIDDIHRQKVDVFCPCALGQSINSHNIEELQCKIIAGGANDQLESISIGERLFEKNILYAPDYIVNAGGLISVCDEYKNKEQNKQIVEKAVQSIKDILSKIFLISEEKNKSTSVVANEIAENIFNRF